jgi:hypothetical protein
MKNYRYGFHAVTWLHIFVIFRNPGNHDGGFTDLRCTKPETMEVDDVLYACNTNP